MKKSFFSHHRRLAFRRYGEIFRFFPPSCIHYHCLLTYEYIWGPKSFRGTISVHTNHSPLKKSVPNYVSEDPIVLQSHPQGFFGTIPSSQIKKVRIRFFSPYVIILVFFLGRVEKSPGSKRLPGRGRDAAAPCVWDSYCHVRAPLSHTAYPNAKTSHG